MAPLGHRRLWRVKVVALSDCYVNCTAHAQIMKLHCLFSGKMYTCTHVFVTDSANYPCRYGKLEIVKYLIEVQGCSAGCTDNSGQTPLHYAFQ